MRGGYDLVLGQVSPSAQHPTPSPIQVVIAVPYNPQRNTLKDDIKYKYCPTPWKLVAVVKRPQKSK